MAGDHSLIFQASFCVFDVLLLRLYPESHSGRLGASSVGGRWSGEVGARVRNVKCDRMGRLGPAVLGLVY